MFQIQVEHTDSKVPNKGFTSRFPSSRQREGSKVSDNLAIRDLKVKAQNLKISEIVKVPSRFHMMFYLFLARTFDTEGSFWGVACLFACVEVHRSWWASTWRILKVGNAGMFSDLKFIPHDSSFLKRKGLPAVYWAEASINECLRVSFSSSRSRNFCRIVLQFHIPVWGLSGFRDFQDAHTGLSHRGDASVFAIIILIIILITFILIFISRIVFHAYAKAVFLSNKTAL